jgi:hypothetical protein
MELTATSISARELAKIIHGATSTLPRIDGTKAPEWDLLSSESQRLAEIAVKEIFENCAKYFGRPSSAKDYHDLWMNLKLNEGWKHGTSFSLVDKTHPSLIPFEDLPLSEKIKDEVWFSLTVTLRKYWDGKVEQGERDAY